jgi:hypothetical protein
MNSENRECIIPPNMSMSKSIKQCSKLSIKTHEVNNKIGEGGFGVIFSIIAMIKGKPTKAVVKVIEHNINRDEKRLIKDFYYEVDYSEKMGNLGIGPKIYDAFYKIDKNTLVQNIIMERFDISVDKWLESDIYPKGANHVVSSMLKLLRKQIFEIQIYCSDIKPQNYVIKLDNYGIPKTVKMIDFGTDWCSVNIPNIYITAPSLRVYQKKTHKEIFYCLCVIQLFVFVIHSFKDISKALPTLAHFYADKLFIDYVINRGKKYRINTELVFYDVLETDREHAKIIKHYLGVYSNDNETLIKGVFKDIDRVTKLISQK